MLKKYKPIFINNIVNIFEWYDFSLLVYFASVIHEKFFPPGPLNLLQIFTIFALGYFSRIFGGIVLGYVGDIYGRKPALVISVFGMALGTGIIGLLPSYEQIGDYATTAIFALRILQGFSIGGAFSSCTTFCVEYAEVDKKSLITSFAAFAAYIGLLLGSITHTICYKYISIEILLSWGWRLPFLFSFLFAILGWHLKKYSNETPEFLTYIAKTSTNQQSIAKVIGTHYKKIICSVSICITTGLLMYLQGVYVINYLKIYRNFPEGTINDIMLSSYIVAAISCIIGGKLSDMFGQKNTLTYTLTFIIMYMLFFGKIFQYGTLTEVFLMQIMLSALAGIYIGSDLLLHALIYPAHVRTRGFGISYTIGIALCGGTTPYLCQYIVERFGDLQIFGYYAIFIAAISMVGVRLYTLSEPEYEFHKQTELNGVYA